MENLYWAVPQIDKIPVFVKMSLFVLLVMYNNIGEMVLIVILEGTFS